MCRSMPLNIPLNTLNLLWFKKIYFLPNNKTIGEGNYITVLRDHCFFSVCFIFMGELSFENFWKRSNFSVLRWLGISPKMNPIKNTWNLIKNAIVVEEVSNLTHYPSKLWVTMKVSYFASLVTSIFKRVETITKCNGNIKKVMKICR